MGALMNAVFGTPTVIWNRAEDIRHGAWLVR